MKIGILETGLVNKKLEGRFETYPAMFAALLDQAGQNFEYQTYSVINGEMPESVDDCDGWLITGSRHGVYENLDWMLSLASFIRNIRDANKPLVGICFGHQIIAHALGGTVTQSDKGWGVGLHHYAIEATQPWMNGASEQIRIYAFHQDQVSRLPENAQVFIRSDFCPYAGLTYGRSIMSIQAHPEFEASYEQALLDAYGGNIVPETVTAKAQELMQGKDAQADTKMLADWIARFFVDLHSH